MAVRSQRLFARVLTINEFEVLASTTERPQCFVVLASPIGHDVVIGPEATHDIPRAERVRIVIRGTGEDRDHQRVVGTREQIARS